MSRSAPYDVFSGFLADSRSKRSTVVKQRENSFHQRDGFGDSISLWGSLDQTWRAFVTAPFQGSVDHVLMYHPAENGHRSV